MRVHHANGYSFFSGGIDDSLDLDSELYVASAPLLMLLGVEDFLNGLDEERYDYE